MGSSDPDNRFPDPVNRFREPVPVPGSGRSPNRFPPPTGVGNRIGGGTGAELIRQRRDATVARCTTRIPGNRFPVESPFWLVTIAWPNERCPDCGRPLDPDMQAGYDEDVQACFCLGCTRRWLDEEEPPPPRRATVRLPAIPPAPVQLELEIS